MSGLKDFLTLETYIEYKRIIYSEMEFILQNKKEYICFDKIQNSEKKRKISEIYDFLYLEKDEENYKKIEDLLIVLKVKENMLLN
jgi:hypothetical protein